MAAGTGQAQWQPPQGVGDGQRPPVPAAQPLRRLPVTQGARPHLGTRWHPVTEVPLSPRGLPRYPQPCPCHHQAPRLLNHAISPPLPPSPPCPHSVPVVSTLSPCLPHQGGAGEMVHIEGVDLLLQLQAVGRQRPAGTGGDTAWGITGGSPSPSPSPACPQLTASAAGPPPGRRSPGRPPGAAASSRGKWPRGPAPSPMTTRSPMMTTTTTMTTMSPASLAAPSWPRRRPPPAPRRRTPAPVPMETSGDSTGEDGGVTGDAGVIKGDQGIPGDTGDVRGH